MFNHFAGSFGSHVESYPGGVIYLGRGEDVQCYLMTIRSYMFDNLACDPPCQAQFLEEHSEHSCSTIPVAFVSWHQGMLENGQESIFMYQPADARTPSTAITNPRSLWEPLYCPFANLWSY